MTEEKTRIITECAILIALGFVLSFVKIWRMPMGGSVTAISMLPVAIIGLRHGTRWGLGSAFVYSVFQLFQAFIIGDLKGLSVTVFIVCLLFDYIIPFTVLGITGFFKNSRLPSKLFGIGLAVFLRFVCHFISGITIWGEYAASAEQGKYLYSLLYNGSYLLPELIITVIGGFFVIKALSNYKIKI